MLALVVGGKYLEHLNQPSPVFQTEIDDSLAELVGQDLDLPSNKFRLDIPPAQMNRSGAEVSAMLKGWDDKSHPVIYWLNWEPENLVYTMSASGVDNKQHLVNSYLEGYAPFEVENVMTPLYILAQRKSYQFDAKNYYGREDVWQSSRQAYFYSRGDCEDHAIILADWLISMGEDARVVVGNWQGTGHAWVVLNQDNQSYLLEATRKSGVGRNKAYPLANLYPDYEPQYMFDRKNFWVTSLTETKVKSLLNAKVNIYADNYWEKRSRYLTLN